MYSDIKPSPTFIVEKLTEKLMFVLRNPVCGMKVIKLWLLLY